MSEDPARDGVNWYAYCNNNPLSFTDPTGLQMRINIQAISSGIASFIITTTNRVNEVQHNANVQINTWQGGVFRKDGNIPKDCAKVAGKAITDYYQALANGATNYIKYGSDVLGRAIEGDQAPVASNVYDNLPDAVAEQIDNNPVASVIYQAARKLESELSPIVEAVDYVKSVADIVINEAKDATQTERE